MASVELQQVEKVFENGTKVVSDFNLAIRDHEFIVLVGPSGCGKSTTLRMIAGLEAVSGGTISIDGRVVNEVPPKDRDIAMVFQNYALYPHMSVYDNMAFGLRMRKTDRKTLDHKVRQAASTLGIEGLLDRLPKQLSGGQRQRVALGRAIVRDPKCFLFDEPLSNLDARLRIEMRAELKRLHLELKTTTIYVTHDQEEAITLGDRVVVMQGGTIQQCDQALKIYREPVNRFVAAFLGCPPMNFLNGRLDAKGAQLVFETGQEWIKVPAWAMAALAAHAGQPIVLGIRPEAVSDAAHARFPIGEQAIAATVSLVQPLGHKMDVYLKTTSGAQLTAQLDSGAPIQLGDRLTIHMDPERIHFFAPGENGKNIAPRSSIAG